MNIKPSYILLFVSLIITSFTTNSCKKEKDTIAKIKVVDENGELIPNAEVHLFPDPSIILPRPIIIDDYEITNFEGIALFDYTENFNLGQAGFSVLNIEVNSGDTIFGEGIIKIEEERTTEEVIILE